MIWSRLPTVSSSAKEFLMPAVSTGGGSGGTPVKASGGRLRRNPLKPRPNRPVDMALMRTKADTAMVTKFAAVRCGAERRKGQVCGLPACQRGLNGKGGEPHEPGSVWNLPSRKASCTVGIKVNQFAVSLPLDAEGCCYGIVRSSDRFASDPSLGLQD